MFLINLRFIPFYSVEKLVNFLVLRSVEHLLLPSALQVLPKKLCKNHLPNLTFLLLSGLVLDGLHFDLLSQEGLVNQQFMSFTGKFIVKFVSPLLL